MDAETLRQYLEYYEDLGIKTLYRRAAPPQSFMRIGQVPEGAEGEALFRILDDISDCQRCRLHEHRTKIVFVVGSEQSKLVFVGVCPGANEAAQGITFVGRAVQLLTQMIEGTAKKDGI